MGKVIYLLALEATDAGEVGNRMRIDRMGKALEHAYETRMSGGPLGGGASLPSLEVRFLHGTVLLKESFEDVIAEQIQVVQAERAASKNKTV